MGFFLLGIVIEYLMILEDQDQCTSENDFHHQKVEKLFAIIVKTTGC